MDTIREVTCPSRSEFERILTTSEPMVIKGVIEHWPAFQRWSLEYLREKLARRTFRVCATDTGEQKLHVSKATRRDADEVFRSFTSSDVREQQRFIVAQVRILDDAPALLEDIAWPTFLNVGKLYQLCFWIAARETRTSLHWDGLPAVLSLVMGEKDFWFLPPEDAENVYPNPLSDYPFLNRSRVDCFAPDLEKFPRYAKVHPRHVRLRAGDMMFVPPYWWHYVKNAGLAAAVRWEFDGYPSEVPFFNDRHELLARGRREPHKSWPEQANATHA